MGKFVGFRVCRVWGLWFGAWGSAVSYRGSKFRFQGFGIFAAWSLRGVHGFG